MSLSPLYLEARQMLVDALKRHLIGPREDEEIIAEHPREHYHFGYLISQEDKTPVEADIRDDDVVDMDKDEPWEDEVLPINKTRNVRAIGITFQLVPGSDISIHAEWARYFMIRREDRTEPSWQREAFTFTFDMTIAHQYGHQEFKQAGMAVRVLTRPLDDWVTTTISVINRGHDKDDTNGRQYDDTAYQVKLSVIDVKRQGIFAPRVHRASKHDNEFWRDEIRFRRIRGYAVGHGCAVDWEGDGFHVHKIYTEWLPTVEVRRASSKVLESEETLSMNRLGDLSWESDNMKGLARIAQSYRRWIDDLHDSVDDIVEQFPHARDQVRMAANEILQENREVYQRFIDGVNFLDHDSVAMKAFSLANRAMALAMQQRDPSQEPRWRAFQLVFVVMTLPSAVDRSHPERNIFDLIWFPTGGGKTEAYLGLAATVIFYRRLKNQPGVAVLTRYTLRLLTVQQFERASRMICAAELVRREEPDLQQGLPILGGLFVGRQLTPNTLDDARALLADSDAEGTTNTLPLVRCPWCGTPLDTTFQSAEKYLKTRCPDTSCAFTDEIPIRVIDEDIYLQPPDMVVATIDKFARMPWEARIAALFDSGPDLIIQDELHLIGDALGSIAALYEAVVDGLCLNQGFLPKIIGSTATTRRTDSQVDILFNRKLKQFPAGGLDVRDAFFYREDGENPGRLYVGIHAMGRSMPHTLERTAGLLLQQVTKIENDAVRDQYWTLAVYFKALRELGGALVLMQDSVPRYMESLVKPLEPVRMIQVEELTSHVPSRTIPEVLSRLSQPIVELQDEEQLGQGAPVDAILATNMISVGIDIDRLGLMIVDGQPHSVSEYIQATSRVGRKSEAAGLVVALFNWARPRDRSIYEQFRVFHQAMYRFVEPTSATPFSVRARERALHAVLFALARLSIPELQAYDSPHRILEPAVTQAVNRLIDRIIDRVTAVDPEESASTRRHLQDILEKWRFIAREYGALKWTKNPYSTDPAILYPLDEGLSDVIGWVTMQSMREVSPPARVKILSHHDLQQGRNLDGKH